MYDSVWYTLIYIIFFDPVLCPPIFKWARCHQKCSKHGRRAFGGFRMPTTCAFLLFRGKRNDNFHHFVLAHGFVLSRWNWNPRLPGVQKACQEIKDSYEFDVFQHGGFMEFYSPEQNIVCTTDSFFVGPTTELQCKRFPDFPWTCVGPLLNPAAKRIHNANVTAELLVTNNANWNFFAAKVSVAQWF